MAVEISCIYRLPTLEGIISKLKQSLVPSQEGDMKRTKRKTSETVKASQP